MSRIEFIVAGIIGHSVGIVGGGGDGGFVGGDGGGGDAGGAFSQTRRSGSMQHEKRVDGVPQLNLHVW